MDQIDVTFSDLRKLQIACTNILFKLDDICKQLNITYYISYGTLLGAVRHKGFIPWDDDIDVLMPREDYNIFLSQASQYLPLPLEIHHYSTEHYVENSFIIRLCDPRVQYIRVIDRKDCYFDSFVSIFPIDGMPRGRMRRKLFQLNVDFAYTKLRFVRSYQCGYGAVKRSCVENIGIVLNQLLALGKGKSIRIAAKNMDKVISKYPMDYSDKVCSYGYGDTPFSFDLKSV